MAAGAQGEAASSPLTGSPLSRAPASWRRPARSGRWPWGPQDKDSCLEPRRQWNTQGRGTGSYQPLSLTALPGRGGGGRRLTACPLSTIRSFSLARIVRGGGGRGQPRSAAHLYYLFYPAPLHRDQRWRSAAVPNTAADKVEARRHLRLRALHAPARRWHAGDGGAERAFIAHAASTPLISHHSTHHCVPIF